MAWGTSLRANEPYAGDGALDRRVARWKRSLAIRGGALMGCV